MGQRGFWNEQQGVAKLQEKKPGLTRLTESFPWESSALCLARATARSAKAMVAANG